jgi:hypothetical protein
VTALRDNPLAIAEGATGAPRVTALARTCVKVFFYAGGAAVSVTGLGGYGGVSIDASVVNLSGRAGLVMAVSTDNGATWSSDYTILTTFYTTVNPPGEDSYTESHTVRSSHSYYNFSSGLFQSTGRASFNTSETGAINALRFDGGDYVCVTPDAGLIAL